MGPDPNELDPETLVRLGCIETLNRGDIEKTYQFYTDDATYVTAGIEDLIDQGRMWQQAVPDLEADITETVVDDGGITFEYVVRGTHEGELADIPLAKPSRRKASAPPSSLTVSSMNTNSSSTDSASSNNSVSCD